LEYYFLVSDKPKKKLRRRTVPTPEKVTVNSGERPDTAENHRSIEKARLILMVGDGVGKSFEVLDEATIGRDPDCEIQPDFSDVSRRHARVRRIDDRFEVEDLGSRNGTLINAQPVNANEPMPLNFGDRIQVGTHAVYLFTYQDAIEDQLLQAQKMESVGQLAGGIAHEFNNLLGAVLNNVDYIEDLEQTLPVGDEDVRSCLRDIKGAVGRAVELTNQLLDFTPSRTENKPLDLSRMIEDVARMIHRTFDRAIEVKTEVEPGLMVLGDRAQLHQIVMNICLNARDAMPDGGHLQLKVRSIHVNQAGAASVPFVGAGQHVALTVSDDGCGMSKETVKRAFDPFFTTKPPGQGTGLGLSMVYGIVKNHGGTVQIQSEPEDGTTVRIYLPAHMPDEETRPTSPSEFPAVGAAVDHVLLVDDEEVVRKSTARLLELQGYNVLCAEDGQEGVALFKSYQPLISFVVLDVIMPKMGGMKAFEAMREIDPEVPIIVTSGYTQTEKAKEFLDRGAVGFLSKPYRSDALKAMIAKIKD
jgi:signal transduction histidine kinase/CheY-like chemotaxis protein